jgi:hypothetical protein
VTRPFDWTDFLGQHRTIAIHTPILAWAGDYHAAALFEELVWRWNSNDRQSFTAPDAELMAKLYMTRGALRGARARLAELGAVETVKRGIPPVLHYTVKTKAVTAPVESTLVRNSPKLVSDSAQREANSEPTYIPESVQSKQSNGIAPPGTVPPAASPLASLDANPSKASDPTPPPVPLAPPTPKPRASKAPKADPTPRERDPFFDAFCRSFGLPDGGGKKAGLAGAFSVDCKREGATLDQFRSFYRANAGEWGKFNCQPHNVGGAFLAWRIGQGLAGDPMADAAEIMPDGKPYDPFNVKHYLARKAIREAADTERMRAAR